MSAIGLGIVLDGVIILLLGATVIYAMRLTSYLKAFRDSRSALETLVAELSLSIEQAERAIEGLRSSARDSGRDLQTLINDASALSDELQIMTEAGDNMALRLEKVAEKSSQLSHQQQHQAYQPDAIDEKDVHRSPLGEFSIMDSEFEGDEWKDSDSKDADFPSFLTENEDEDNEFESFQSRAERELFEAILEGDEHEANTGGL